MPENTSRLSLRESLRQRTMTRSDTRHSMISGSYPPNDARHTTLPNELPVNRNSDTHNRTTEEDNMPRTTMLRTRTRLNRFRNSLSFPFLGSSQDRSQSGQMTRQMPGRPSRVTFADDVDHLLPPLSTMDHRLDMEDLTT